MQKYTYDREDLANRLSDGCILGHTTPHSTKIWVRVAVAGTYTLIVSTQRIQVAPDAIGEQLIDRYLQTIGIQNPILEHHDFQPETDKTHVFPISGLNPNTVYYYAVVAVPQVNINRRWRFGFENPHCFTTPLEKPTEVTFGYFSCHDPFKKGTSGMDLWEDFFTILTEYRASFVIGGGDQMYMDCTKEDIWDWVKDNKDSLWEKFRYDAPGLIEYFKTIYRYVYRKYWSFPEVKKVFRSFPMYMIWDDHEIMDGWGSYTEEERSDKLDSLFEWENPEQNLFLVDAMFQAAKAVYIEYQHSHNPVNTLQPAHDPFQFDYPISHGDIGLYTLDMRGHREYRDDDSNDGERILGAVQFARLQNWIESSEIQEKKALCIISPVPVVHWHSTLMNVLDISIAKDDFRDEWDHESNKIFQFTSSAITRPPAPKVASAMVLDRGKLGHKDNTQKWQITSFEKLLFVARHNFGLIRCQSTENNGIEIWGHLYSSEHEDNELILSRVKLS
jgi:alkaline phosphatase D